MKYIKADRFLYYIIFSEETNQKLMKIETKSK